MTHVSHIRSALSIGPPTYEPINSDPRIPGRRIQFLVPQEGLDVPDFSAAFEEMGRKAMAERMQRHALSDPGRFCRLVEYAVEVARGHRPATRLSAGK